MKQRIPHALVRDLEDRFPFGAPGVVAELHYFRRHIAELHFKLVVIEPFRIETDVFLPLPEIIRPIVERCNLRHNYFPSNFATRFSLYALSPSTASPVAKA